MSVEAVRLLLRAGAPLSEVEDALGRAVSAGQTLARMLEESSPRLQARLERELERVEVPATESVRVAEEQLALLPQGLPERLGVLPIHKDARSGRVDVVALDPLDSHLAAELEFHLGAKVRVLRAEPNALRAALETARAVRTPSGPPLPLVRKAVSLRPRPSEAAAAPPPEPAATPSDRAASPAAAALDEPVLSLARQKSRRPAEPLPPVLPLELARSDFERTRTPDDVVAGLLSGLAPARTVVLAVRSSSYVGRAGSAGFEPEAVRRIDVLNSSPSVLQTATRAGFYLGALPHTPPHAGLRGLFGDSDEEVYVASVTVSDHPTLVVVCDFAALGGSVDATRRIDTLTAAAGQALERILVTRKRGG